MILQSGKPMDRAVVLKYLEDKCLILVKTTRCSSFTVPVRQQTLTYLWICFVERLTREALHENKLRTESQWNGSQPGG